MQRRILWRHSLLPGHEQSYAPTDKGRETLCVRGCEGEGVRGRVCVGVEGRVGGRCEGCLHGGV